VTLHVAYDSGLLKWQLGKGHPTNPVRAKNAVGLLRKSLGAEVVVEAITRAVTDEELSLVHDFEYISAVRAGWNSEWVGRRPDLGACAIHMFAGTLQLVDGVLDGRVRYGFAPQGAKHHAMRDYGSGFCVLADWSHAAEVFTRAGKRVFVLDTDAHHGDGTEALTRDNPNVMTASVHDGTIFPGTGLEGHDEARGVLNYALARGAGDAELTEAVGDALDRARAWGADVVLFAVGGDGYKDDPLSSLGYTYGGYETVARMVGAFVGSRDLPIILGGAGGYLPHGATPRVWARVVTETYRSAEFVRNSVHGFESVVQ
jgi:acetoin utilization protein AcuC